MVSLGLSFRGKGTMRFAPAKTKIIAEEYRGKVGNTYLPDCRELYGVSPTCIFQRDGASSHTASAIRALCKEKFPNFRSEAEWPANSPDLNPLDFFACGVPSGGGGQEGAHLPRHAEGGDQEERGRAPAGNGAERPDELPQA